MVKKPIRKDRILTILPMEGTCDACLNIGKGRKMCLKCNAIVGARTKKCKCGYEFSPKVKGWSICKATMLTFINSQRSDITLMDIAKARKTHTHPGCLLKQCSMDNKQLQQFLNELIKEKSLIKDGKKYKVSQ